MVSSLRAHAVLLVMVSVFWPLCISMLWLWKGYEKFTSWNLWFACQRVLQSFICRRVLQSFICRRVLQSLTCRRVLLSLICRRVLQSLICLSMRGFPVTCIIYNNLKLWQGMMFIFLICLVGEYTLLISSVYWCQQNSFGFFAWDLVSNILNIQQF